MSFFNRLRRRKPKAMPVPQLDAEHEQLRRAIERCDALKPAYDAGQLTIDEVIAMLQRNAFGTDVARKAIAEAFGEAAAKQL